MQKDSDYKDAIYVYGKNINTNYEDLLTYRRKITLGSGDNKEIQWFEGLHGAYAIVNCPLPNTDKGCYITYYAATALFSSDPDKLLKVLEGDSSHYEEIFTLPVYKHKDTGINESASYGVFVDLINRHYDNYKIKKRRDTVFHQDGDHVLRSETSAIFTVPDKKQGGYNIYLYRHPRADRGLPINSPLLRKGLYKNLMASLSIRVNDTPIDENSLQGRMYQVADLAARDYIAYEDPVKRYVSKAQGYSKLKKIIKSSSQLAIQNMAHLVARVNKPALVTGTLMAGVAAAGTHILMMGVGIMQSAGLAALSVAGLRALLFGNNPLPKLVKGASNFAKRHIYRNRLVNVSHHQDYGPMLSPLQPIVDLENRSHYTVTRALCNKIMLVKADHTATHWLPDYTDAVAAEWKRKRAEAVDGFSGACFIRLSHDEMELTSNTINGKRPTYGHPLNDKSQIFMTRPAKPEDFDIFPEPEKKRHLRAFNIAAKKRAEEERITGKVRFRRDQGGLPPLPHEVRAHATAQLYSLRS